MKQVSLVVVNYNNSECSIKMLGSLEKDMNYIDTVIIVDNDSAEQDILKLKEFIKSLDRTMQGKVSLLESGENQGYFAGLNFGLEQLRSKERVIIANNDIEFAEGFFQRVSSDRFEGSVFAICPDVETIDGFHQNPHVVSKFSWLKRRMFDMYFSNYHVGQLILKLKRLVAKKRGHYVNKAIPVHMGIGACFILTEHFFQHYKQLDYPSFLYGEEAFLSHQIHKKGGVLLYDPKYKLIHMESVATSKIPSRVKYKMTQDSYKLYREYL